MAYDRSYFRWREPRAGPRPAPNNFEPRWRSPQQFRDYQETNYSFGTGQYARRTPNHAHSNFASTQRPATHINSAPTTSTSTPKHVDADIHCFVLPNERFYLPTALLPLDSYAVLRSIEDSNCDAGLEIYHFPNKCHPAVVATLSALVPPLRVGNLPDSELPSRVRRTGEPARVQARDNHVTPTSSANSSGGIATVVSGSSNIISPPPPPTLLNASPNTPRAPKNRNTTGPADVSDPAAPIQVNVRKPGQSGNGSTQAPNLGPDLPVFLECRISSVNYFYLDTALIPERGVRCIVVLKKGREIIFDGLANLCHIPNAQHKQLVSDLSSLEPPIFLSELPKYQDRLSLSSGSIESLRPVRKLDSLPLQCYVFNIQRYFLRINDVAPEARQQLVSSSYGAVRGGLFHFPRYNYEMVASALKVHSSSHMENQSGPQGFVAPEREIPTSSANKDSSRQQAVPSSTPHNSATTTPAVLLDKFQQTTSKYLVAPPQSLPAPSVRTGPAVPNSSTSSTTPVNLASNPCIVVNSAPQKSAPNAQIASTGNNRCQDPVHVQPSKPNHVLVSNISPPAPPVVHSRRQTSPAVATQMQRASSGIAQMPNPASTAPIHSTINPRKTPIPPPVTHAQAPTSAKSAQGQPSNIPMIPQTHLSNNVQGASSTSGQNGMPPSQFVPTDLGLHRPIPITPPVLSNPHETARTKSSCNPTVGQRERSIPQHDIARLNSEHVQIHAVCASRKEMPQISGYQTTLTVLPPVTFPWDLQTFNKIIKFTLPVIPSPCLKVLFGLRVYAHRGVAQTYFTKLNIWINGEAVEERRNTSCCNLDIPNSWANQLRFGENCIRISSKLGPCEFSPNICYFVVVAAKINAAIMMEKLAKKECAPIQTTILLVKFHLEREAESGIIVQDSKVTASLLCPLGKAKMRIPCRGSTCRHYKCFDAFNFIKLYESSEIWKCPICDSHIEFDNLRIDGLFQEILNSVGKDPKVNEVTIDSKGKYAPVISPVSRTSQNEVIAEDDGFDGIDLTGVNSIYESDSSVHEIDVTDSDDECARQKQKRKAKSEMGGQSKIQKLAEKVQKCNCTTGCATNRCTCKRLGEICGSRCHPSGGPLDASIQCSNNCNALTAIPLSAQGGPN